MLNNHFYHLSETLKLSPLVTKNTKPSAEKAGCVDSLAEFLIVCSDSEEAVCLWKAMHVVLGLNIMCL